MAGFGAEDWKFGVAIVYGAVSGNALIGTITVSAAGAAIVKFKQKKEPVFTDSFFQVLHY
jgi:hypothetical protein